MFLSLSLRVFPAIITKHCPYDVWLLQNCFLPKLSATGAANCTNGYQHRNINGKVCSVFHVQCLPLKHWESHASSITYIPTQTAWSSIGSILFGIHMRCMREMGLVTCRQKEIHQTKAAEHWPIFTRRQPQRAYGDPMGILSPMIYPSCLNQQR